MRDGRLLAAVKRVAAWRYGADLAIQRAFRRGRGERPWSLAGECRRCGACCEAPEITAGTLVWAMPLARRLFLWWQRRVNGLELLRTDAATWSFAFRCTHLDPRTHQCDSYGSRPGMCRDYPRLLLWSPNPELLPGCGHRATPRNADGLRASLERLELTPEQREKLRRGLRLDG